MAQCTNSDQANNKKCGCYTVAMNDDGSRLASGGLDGNVKIWDPRLILQFKNYEPEYSDLSKKKRKGDLSKLLDEKYPTRALCTMSRHNGAVTCVKFSPNGSRFLALGSDDKIVLIWEKDEDAAPQKQFGDTELDLEHWTVRKRLVAHDNDVQDIAWSPDGSLLVTVGLDRLIIIWNGNTFERIKRYDIHQSMVKGIVFDPANKFFATASDDRTVRIFRYHRKHPLRGDHEFQMEHLVIDPFKKSPLTSYFRRMSWSPDGQHIAVPNATNGPVTSIAIINRGNWGSDVSLIGHEAPCEVCLFSPRLFKKGDDEDSFSTVLATAGQDLSLVVWSTSKSKPIVVAESIVEDSITDICWSPDGETLYFSCLDGSITCIKFEPKELGVIAGERINDLQLNKYGTDRESAIFAESIDQLKLEEMWRDRDEEEAVSAKEVVVARPGAIMKPEVKKPEDVSIQVAKDVGIVNSTQKNVQASSATGTLKQNITITKDGKKRVAPMLVSSSRPSSSSFSSFSSSVARPISSFKLSAKLSKTLYNLPKIGIQTSVHGLKSRSNAFGGLEPTEEPTEENDNEDMGITEDADQAGATGTTASGPGGSTAVSEITRKRQRNKLKRTFMERRYPSNFRNVSNLPEFLFHHPSLVNKSLAQVPKEVGGGNGGGDWTITTTYDLSDEDLVFSVIESSNIASSTSTIEVRNGPSWGNDEDDEVTHNDRIDFQDPTVCIISNSADQEHRKYSLYFPYKIQHAVPLLGPDGLQFYALISFSGTFQLVNSDTGTFSSPSIELGDNIVIVRQSGKYFLCVTSTGLIYVWELPNLSIRKGLIGIVNGVSMASIWQCNVTEKGDNSVEIIELPTLKVYEIDPNSGTPYIMFEETGEIFQYSTDLMCWIKVLESWYFLAGPISVPDVKPKAVSRILKSVENGNKIHEGEGLYETLVNKSQQSFQDSLKRGFKLTYIGDTEPINELRENMKERYYELLELARTKVK